MKSVIKKIMLSSGIFLILSIVLVVFSYSHITTSQLECGTQIPVESFCGTGLGYHPDTEKGRALFNANCAACHHKTKRRTGPTLSQIDSITFRSWLSVDTIKIDSAKFSDYGIDYHKITWGATLDKIEVGQIIDYCLKGY